MPQVVLGTLDEPQKRHARDYRLIWLRARTVAQALGATTLRAN